MDSLSPYRPNVYPSPTLLGEHLAKADITVSPGSLHLEPLSGNLNRRDFHSRKNLRVISGEKTLCMLTIGSGLEDLWKRSSAFAEACPSITCKPLFLYREGEHDLLASEFFAGRNLETLLREKRISPSEAQHYGTLILAALERTLQPSRADLAAKEIDAFLERVCTLPLFPGIDQSFLRRAVFPFVRSGFLAGSLSTRWTNGDLIARNILVDDKKNVRLIDYEFAARTHLFAEDAWRWQTFSVLPPEFSCLPGYPKHQQEPPWVEAFCLLRQLMLAQEVNGAQLAVPDSQPSLIRLREITTAFHDGFRTSVFLRPLGQLPEYQAQALQVGEKLRALELAHKTSEQSNRTLEAANQTLEAALLKQQQDNARLARLLSLRAARLARMEASLGWRTITGLKKLLTSLTFSKPPKFNFHLDTPRAWLPFGAKLEVRGWCFPIKPFEICEVRIQVDGRTFDGVYGADRADVGQSHPAHPQAYRSGFDVEIELQAADKLLEIAFCDSSDRWHVVRRFDLTKKTEAVKGTYAHWVKECDTLTANHLAKIQTEVASLPLQPLISVVMPVYNTPESYLTKAIESVRAQVYPHWELCIADDASTAAHVRPMLERYARQDKRIKLVFRESNGHIAAASNSALTLAMGEYVALLDHDDELRPHALAEVVKAINRKPDLQLIYSDEDKLDAHGNRFDPYFKPDWMPDLLIGHNYVCHFSVSRADTLREIGGWRAGFDGAQDWDLQLRIIEKAKPEQIVHIPHILYHWRAVAGSTALATGEKDYVVEAARRALTGHFERTGEQVELIHQPGNHWRARYGLPKPAPFVSLVIPSRNGLKHLRCCIDGILEKTSYPAYEILVIDNGSDDPETKQYLQHIAEPRSWKHAWGGECSIRVLPYPQPFNYSAINNFGVREARGEFVGLLNNDLEVITPDWLEEMVSQAARPGIGCVGAMLYFPNDTLQHAGVVLGIGGVAGHAFKGFPRGTPGSMNRARLAQNFSAVTGACLVVRKSIYDAVGGLDEKNLGVSLNDVDFCLKVRAAGYRNLWTPFAEFYHHESATRGYEDTPEKQARFEKERAVMKQRWGALLAHDPAYNPNLTLDTEDFALAYPPRFIN